MAAAASQSCRACGLWPAVYWPDRSRFARRNPPSDEIVAARNHLICDEALRVRRRAGLSGKAGSGKIVCVVKRGKYRPPKFARTGLNIV